VEELTCETCRWWRRINADRMIEFDKSTLMSDEEDDLVMVGECHRFPPSLYPPAGDEHIRLLASRHHLDVRGDFVGTLESATQWPVTWCFDDCGEHSPRVPLPVAAPG